MTVTSIVSRAGLAAARDLRGAIEGQVIIPGDDDYACARTIWNSATDRRPAVIVRCETTRDVQMAVRAASNHDLRLSVRGGGHDWAGRSQRENGLVIDLSTMRHVDIDAARKFAIVAGGATAKDVVGAAAPRGLVAVTGNCGTVGLAGLTLGGGYGPLSGRYGLAADNLLGAEVVLADGRFVIADFDRNPELFWALRGGGGNFGVVTAMRVRLHPVQTLLAGMILFPWSDAELALRGYAQVMETAPEELTAMTGVLSAPDGAPALFVAPTWCGEAARGRRIMAALQNVGAPTMTQIGPMAYGDLLGMYDAQAVHGRAYMVKTRWLPRLTAKVISALSAAGGARTSPFSVIALHHFHGAPARVRADGTAFGLRREHFLLEVVAAWEPTASDNGASHRLWAENLSDVLAPDALPGGYANLLGPDDHDQIAAAYGDNLARLQHAKHSFDPGNVFSAIPLPTGKSHRPAPRREAAGHSLLR